MTHQATLLFALLALAGEAHTQTLERASGQAGNVAGAPANGEGNAYARHPAISADDRFVAFGSGATNLPHARAGDSNGVEDIFVRDRATTGVVRVSVSSAGLEANGASFRPSISGNGRFVVFTSSASNLVAGDTNGMWDVFRRDRDTDADLIFDEPGAVATIRVSVGPGGVQGNGPSNAGQHCLSDDGDRVAFESMATNFIPAGDLNVDWDAFVRHVSAATTRLANATASGVQGNIGAYGLTISGDGNWVAFNTSFANSTLVPDSNGTGDVLLKNLSSGAISRVSQSTSGAEGNGYSWRPALSYDGRFVAFISGASNLHETPDLNGWIEDVFLRDTVLGTTRLVSSSALGAPASASAETVTISNDGAVIAFRSNARNLLNDDSNGLPDVVVVNLATGLVACGSCALGGPVGNLDSGFEIPAISGDGSHIAFASHASNLGPIDTNGVEDVYVLGDPMFAIMGSGLVDTHPVTFSVNGPVGPQPEGIRYQRGFTAVNPAGTPIPPQVPMQPGNPIGFGIRMPAVAQASGIDCMNPGDVFDFDLLGVPSEAVLFQSPPVLYPGAEVPFPRPDRTNNQILLPEAIGLAAGLPVPVTEWAMAAPMRDNVDAISFGEDYFPIDLMTGYDTLSGFPSPPMEVGITPWAARLSPPSMSPFAEPIVDMAGPVSLRFSVDPWAIGAAGTAVSFESGGADVGARLGPWISAGDAAGDVFGTPLLERSGGTTAGGGSNALVHDQATLALAPVTGAMLPAEDDVDALECTGDNTIDWGMPMAEPPGSLHDRVDHVVGVGLPDPFLSAHEPVNSAPVFFSVTRSSPGVFGTAVRTAFVGGGAAADIFVTVKTPGTPLGEGTNLLFIDEAEIGLLDTDDLDGLILWICPEYRDEIAATLELIATAGPMGLWSLPGAMGERTGPGMELSVTKYLATAIPADCIRVGFSVSTDSIGMQYTAVDYEAGGVNEIPSAPDPSAAPGDVFYAVIDGTAANTNYLWFEAEDLGLDPGAWTFPVPPGSSLALLSDNVDGLDSIDMAPACAGTVRSYGAGCPGMGGFTPILQVSGCPQAGQPISINLWQGAGGAPAIMGLGLYEASIPLGGSCFLRIDPVGLAIPLFLSGAGPGMGMASIPLRVPPGVSGATITAQAFVFDPASSAGYSNTNGFEIGFP